MLCSIKKYNNEIMELDLPEEIISESLYALPGLTDPHVHFRVPGHEHKEDWGTGSKAALSGGITRVFDMPNNNPPVISESSLLAKKELINKQLEKFEKKIKWHLYFGATADNIGEIEKVKDDVIGIKMFMGSSTGNLLVDKKEDQARVFEAAARNDLVLAVHAEDEEIISQNTQNFQGIDDVGLHSRIRNKEAAVKAVMAAISFARQYGTRLYVCHVSTKEELELIGLAKKEGLNVYAEAAPHHLFFTEDNYIGLKTKTQMNPPLRLKEDQEALWEAINSGIIDTIGSDHAPHTLEEKNNPYGKAPSGVPNIETTLALLLDAYNAGKITLEKIVELTHSNINKIFKIDQSGDLTIVDLNLEKKVKNEFLNTKCGWSPFEGRILKGWPVHVIN